MTITSPPPPMRVGIGMFLLLGVVLSACSKQVAGVQEVGAPIAATVQRDMPAQAVAASAAPTRNRSLAYEHTITIELGRQALPERIKELRTTCDSRKDIACAVLDVAESTQLEVPSAHIRMRMAPTGVEPLIGIAARDAKILSRTTHAEDLAEPMADTDRELSQLSSHRDRLNEFLTRRNLTVDQEINLSKEVSSTQVQIDELNTRKTNLRRRVDTEILTIELVPPHEDYGAQRSPISDALHSFGADFRDAIAQVIRFLAVLLPWLVIGIPGVVALRVLWRGITRWLATRERKS